MSIKRDLGMRHLQIGVTYAMKLSDEDLVMLSGEKWTAADVRQELKRMYADGYEVVPCASCVCDERGHCTGIKLDS